MNRSSTSWSHPAYGQIARLVTDASGVAFSDGYAETAEMFIDKAVKDAGARGLGVYLEALRQDSDMLSDLVSALSVGETYFFRDTAQWALIEKQVLPALLARRGTVRLWSAACATGEEAYSLAITAHRLGGLGRSAILGTDVNHSRLEAARQGSYRPWSFRGEQPRNLETYFDGGPGGRRALIPEIRDAVEFRYLNLLDPGIPGPGTVSAGQDLILCRNVFIYFQRETIASVATALIRCLSPDGWLITGASDPRLTDLVECTPVLTPMGLAYRRPNVCGARSPPMSVPPQPMIVSVAAPAAALPSPVGPDPVEPDAVEPDAVEEARPASAPSTADQICARARELADQGQTSAGMALLDDGLTRHGGSSELHYLRSVVLAEQGQHRAAVDAARSALYVDRSMIMAHIAEGTGFHRIGEPARAARCFRNAHRLLADIEPDDAVPYSNGLSTSRVRRAVEANLSSMPEPA